VNPIDWKIRAGYVKDFMPVPMPFIPGIDISGVVEATGPGVTRFKKGDEVFGVGQRGIRGICGCEGIGVEAEACFT